MNDLNSLATPRLMHGVQLHYDEASKRWVLLAPGRVIEIDGVTFSILRLCSGDHTVESIVAKFADEFHLRTNEVYDDIVSMIDELIDDQVLVA